MAWHLTELLIGMGINSMKKWITMFFLLSIDEILVVPF